MWLFFVLGVKKMVPGINTGGGGFSTSSSADGDNSFDNGDFNYKGNKSNDTGLYVVGALVLLAVLYVGRK
jgi:hypothetical protein